MAEKDTTPEQGPLSSTELAYERTVIAEDRTLMAWVRTSVSLFSFGFTIYKFFEETVKVEHHHHFLTARKVAMCMIGLGILGLTFALIDHYLAIQRLRKHHSLKMRPVTSAMSILVWMFGVALFLAALYRD